MRKTMTLFVATLLAYAAPAWGQTPADPNAVDPAPATPFAADAVDETALQKIAGREDTNQHATADMAATVTKNSVGDNSTTGEVRIADNAFQNLSGLSVLNVNTGNNVAINAAMNVNISIRPNP